MYTLQDGDTPLHRAVKLGIGSIVTTLVKHGADRDALDKVYYYY